MNNYLKLWLKIFLVILLFIFFIFSQVYLGGLCKNMNFLFLEFLTIPTFVVTLMKLSDLFDE